MAKKVGAYAFAADIGPFVRKAQAEGTNTLRAIATALNDWGVLTARGKRWRSATVKNLLRRLEPPLTSGEEDFVKWVERCERRKLSPEEVRLWIAKAKAVGDVTRRYISIRENRSHNRVIKPSAGQNPGPQAR